MTEKELNRVKVLEMAEEKRITQKTGAGQLEISERHFRRLLCRYRQVGDSGIVSGHRGYPSNHRMKVEQRAQITQFVHEPRFAGFGPTLLTEKLEEYRGIRISKETMRQMMIAENLHQPKKKKRSRCHPPRERRACRGELVQIDGSYHAWLEDRAPKACLLLFVDDATSEVLAARFVDHESYFSYGQLCSTYFRNIGTPTAFYSDRFSVFRVNAHNVTASDACTQFGRALNELGIELICANSPQAKGRVERANKTFQDRLVKELRLQLIDDYDQANAFLPTFIQLYNRKFAVLPRSCQDVHAPLDPQSDLDFIFSFHQSRIISKDLLIQFQNNVYQIVTSRPVYALAGRDVIAALNHKGEASFFLNRQPLQVELFHRQPKQAQIVDSKSVHHSYKSTPAPDHPWRSYGRKLNGKPVLSSAPD
ncbi:MAG: ISNCY family transposase [Chloroflexota bacterium]|nr:ISNCY family transposase [Chloroflexota bacterium]